MSELSHSELRRLDLTLLLVFLGLVRHRKALDVALELGLTQSAVSQCLKRLRDIFRDELFLRKPHGMEPTATALALEAPISDALESLRGALGVARSFVPSQAKGVIRVAALDAEQAVLVPLLVSRLRTLSPGLSVSVLSLGRGDAIDALTEGRVDFALGFVWNVPETILSEELYEESYLVAGRADVLQGRPRIELDAYCALDHVLISPGGDLRGVVDDRLTALGRERRIVLGLPAFLPALAAVAASGALVTLPSRVARAFAGHFSLETALPPFDLRRFPVSIFWHRRNDADPKTRWVRQQWATLAQDGTFG